MGDSNFPAAVSKSSRGARIRLYESLYKQYSTLNLTHESDRPLAIAGLEQRLINAFQTRGGHGVFQLYFERSLLWKRGSNSALSKIDFPPEQIFRIPSWSWMAYKHGTIDYVSAPFNRTDWKPEIRSPWEQTASASSWHTTDPSVSNTILRGIARDFRQTELDEDILYDSIEPPASRVVKCVLLGKERLEGSRDERSQRHFVLLISPKLYSRGEKEYERVGVGILLAQSISLAGEPPEIQIA